MELQQPYAAACVSSQSEGEGHKTPPAGDPSLNVFQSAVAAAVLHTCVPENNRLTIATLKS